ncbi:MAG: TSUP family transporter, partial [Xanthomonadales bacterium]|nr:TSUP family transporter [Xanthomonadales bacterium]
MTAHLAVALAALFAAGLTLYSGFGLGTLLLPVFALFYPIEVAVGATAVVHGANNVFKVSMLGRYADRRVVIRFGLVAIASAILGASLLALMAGTGSTFEWRLASLAGSTSPLKLLMGVLMLIFAVFELAPRFRALEFDRKYL